MVTLRILSKMFLFHFKKISDNSGLFWMFRDVSVNTSKNSRFVKKKKNVLKTKTNLHSIHSKISKGKKNEKKRNEQRYLYNKL